MHPVHNFHTLEIAINQYQIFSKLTAKNKNKITVAICVSDPES